MNEQNQKCDKGPQRFIVQWNEDSPEPEIEAVRQMHKAIHGRDLTPEELARVRARCEMDRQTE